MFEDSSSRAEGTPSSERYSFRTLERFKQHGHSRQLVVFSDCQNRGFSLVGSSAWRVLSACLFPQNRLYVVVQPQESVQFRSSWMTGSVSGGRVFSRTLCIFSPLTFRDRDGTGRRWPLYTDQSEKITSFAPSRRHPPKLRYTKKSQPKLFTNNMKLRYTF